ncbi:MAG: hypothetical protein KDB73_14385 [Planctomycetes bacterium]|nr:hypothetical protein [Planctomycetota bacterium]
MPITRGMARMGGVTVTTGSLVRRLAGLAVLALAAVALGGGPVRAKDDAGATLQLEGAGIDPWAVWSTHSYDKLPGSPEAVDAYGRVLQPVDAAWTSWDAASQALPAPSSVSLQRMVMHGRGELVAVANDQPGDATRGQHLRALSLTWIDELAASGGAFATQMTAGEAVAFEVVWWPTHAIAPAGDSVLPVVASLVTSTDGGEVLLGLVYAYGSDGWAQRLEALAGEGTPVEDVSYVFPGALASTLGSRTDLVLGGEGLQVVGDLEITDDLDITSDGASIEGTIELGGDLVQDGVLTVDGTVDELDERIDVIDAINLSEARALARASGTYFSRDGTVFGTLPEGAVVFAERELIVDAWFQTANITMVSAYGNIRIRGGGLQLKPARQGLLAFARHGRVEVELDASRLVGAIHAPRSDIRMRLEQVHYVGRLQGRAARIEGQDCYLTNGVPRLPTTSGGSLEESVAAVLRVIDSAIETKNDPAGQAADGATKWVGGWFGR